MRREVRKEVSACAVFRKHWNIAIKGWRERDILKVALQKDTIPLFFRIKLGIIQYEPILKIDKFKLKSVGRRIRVGKIQKILSLDACIPEIYIYKLYCRR